MHAYVESKLSQAIKADIDTLRIGTQAIKQDTVPIRDVLPTLQASTVAIKAEVDTLHAGTQAIKGDIVSIQNALPALQASTIAIREMPKVCSSTMLS